jgi:hypothetical protein
MGWMQCSRVNWRDQMRPVIWAAITAFAIVGADIWLNSNVNADPLPRFVVAVLPSIPAALYVYEQMRTIGKLDELQRRIHHEGLAIAFGVAAVVAVLYGSLHAARFVPAITWQTMWFGMVVLWTVSYVIAALRYR